MGKDLKGKEIGKGILQRKDGRYEARFYDRTGTRHSIYGLSLPEVRKELVTAQAKVIERRDVIKQLTLDQWFETWLDVYKRGCVKPNTIVNYEMMYRLHIKDHLGHIKLTDITKIGVQSVINDLDKAGQGYEQQNKARIIMLDLFNRAIEDDLLIKNPAKGVKTRAKKNSDEVRFLSLDEQEIFFRYCVSSFYDNAFNVHINTGLRPGELFGLVPEDIHLDEGFIDINKTLVYAKYEGDTKKEFHIEEPKTLQSFRKIPINSVCRTYLEDQLRLKEIVALKYPNNDCPFLFTTSFNTPIEAQIYIDAIKRVVAAINLKRNALEEMEAFTGHSFRHTFATRCFEAGIPPKVVQKYLGHATLQMTMDLYTHVTQQRADDDIEKLCYLSGTENIVGLQSRSGMFLLPEKKV